MSAARPYLLAVAAVATMAELANGQVIFPPPGPPQYQCVVHTSATPMLRGEGMTELIGDIVISCTNGRALPDGAPITRVNITVDLPTPITSRVFLDGTSEALLLIDEPNSGLGSPVPGYGPSEPFVICGSGDNGTTLEPFMGCASFAHNVAVNGTPYVVSQSPSGLPAANVYQGLVNGNQVVFFGVPVSPPGTAGTRVFRITNIRTDVTSLNAGTAAVPFQAAVLASNWAALPASGVTPIVGFVQSGMTTSVGPAPTFGQCSAPALAQANILKFSETFGSSFKTRVDPWTNPTTYSSALLQNHTGTYYSSESGFTLPVPGGIAGLADSGTRFKAQFNNIPPGARLFVSASNVNVLSGTATSPAALTNAGTGSFAQLLSHETASDGAGVLPLSRLLGTTAPNLAPGGWGTIPVVEITPLPGQTTATAVWEVVNTNPYSLDTFQFAAFISYPATMVGPGAISVNLSFAPTSTATDPRAGAPIPRFGDTSTPAPLASIVSCAPPAVSAISATPNAGSGTTQDFTFQYSDSSGANNIQMAWAWFNPTLAATATNSCMVYYNNATKMLYMAGDAGQRLAGAMGSAGVLQNSQCSVNLAGAAAVINGNALTLHVAVIFKPGFSGAKNIYMQATDVRGYGSGWQTAGAWIAQ